MTHIADMQPHGLGMKLCKCLRLSSYAKDPRPKHVYSSSRMRFMSNNWSAMKQRLHPQSVVEISRHSVLSGDRIRQCETSSVNVIFILNY